MKKIDPDKSLTAKEWKNLGPLIYGIDGLPKEAREAVINSRGRPRTANPKKSISIRLDADIIDEIRRHGKGWQTEINHVLRAWVENRPW